MKDEPRTYATATAFRRALEDRLKQTAAAEGTDFPRLTRDVAFDRCRLRQLSRSSDGRIAELAALAFEVGAVKPHKRRRLKFLARKRRDLLARLDDTGLIFALDN